MVFFSPRFFQVLFDCLASQDILSFFRAKKSNDNHHELLKRLKIELDSANVLINDAENKQIQDRRVKVWLEGLKEVIYEEDKFMDKINTESHGRKLEHEYENSSS